MTLTLLDISRPEPGRRLETLIQRLRSTLDPVGEVAGVVAEVVEDVRTQGDEAVVRYMRQWTDPDFTAERIAVKPAELSRAADRLSPAIRRALDRAIENVRAYQSHIRPADPPMLDLDGARLGLRFTPIQRVGLHVPGGRASYPSSLIMLAVPAQAAGVPDLSVVCPPPTGSGGDVSPLVLAVAHLLGIERVYRIGGAQAIAALAFGTAMVRPVDFIAGPGNAYTQQAKRQVFGQVGIDGLFGPSEIVVLADGSANPAWVAADLLAQAEHDPGCCFVVSTDGAVLERIAREVERQLPQRTRKEAIGRALAEWSAAILVRDEAEAARVIDTIAAEHVTLAVKDPEAWLDRLHHAGAWFLSDSTPVASGDYYAGPSHCLPTATTARFSSGLSVYTFLKRSSVEHYAGPPHDEAIEHIATLAEAESLEAHAHSIRIRKTNHRDTKTQRKS